MNLRGLSGNSLLEYALPLVIFFITGIVLVFGGVPSRLEAFFLDTVNGSESNGTVAVEPYGTVSASNLPALYSAPNTPIVYPSSTSLSLDLSNYPSDLTNLIETAGANGTTNVLLATLQQYIVDGLASGDLTPAEAQLLTQLANKGHEMAMVEKMVEDRYQSASSYSEFLTPITYDGVVYQNPHVLVAQTIGWQGNNSSANMVVASGDILNPNVVQENPNVDRIGKRMKEFANIYQDAKNAGVLNNSTTDLVVTALAEQIALLSGTVQDYTNDMTGGSGSTYMASTPYVGSLDANLASRVSHVNSVGICATGNGMDAGVQCN